MTLSPMANTLIAGSEPEREKCGRRRGRDDGSELSTSTDLWCKTRVMRVRDEASAFFFFSSSTQAGNTTKRAREWFPGATGQRDTHARNLTSQQPTKDWKSKPRRTAVLGEGHDGGVAGQCLRRGRRTGKSDLFLGSKKERRNVQRSGGYSEAEAAMKGDGRPVSRRHSRPLNTAVTSKKAKHVLGQGGKPVGTDSGSNATRGMSPFSSRLTYS